MKKKVISLMLIGAMVASIETCGSNGRWQTTRATQSKDIRNRRKRQTARSTH